MSKSAKDKLAVLGGTFDPAHLGHLALASMALAQLELEQVLFVLTADPPHKQDRQISAMEDRLAMLELAIADQAFFSISRIEIDRPGPHYAVETVKLLSAKHPGKEIAYLIGSDSLQDLPGWHRPTEFLASISSLVVMRRPGSQPDMNTLKEALPDLEKKLKFIEAPLLEISSRKIRQRAREGDIFRYYLPEKVFDYVQEKQLYR